MIVFYKAMGAELTYCPIKEIAEAEPCDLQMVCCVQDEETHIFAENNVEETHK